MDQVKAAQVAEGIRRELRSILRQLQELRQPFTDFEEVKNSLTDEPRWLVKQAKHCEVIEQRIINCAGSIWQLKDRLKKWVLIGGHTFRIDDGTGQTVVITVEEAAKRCPAVLICGDLFDHWKHADEKKRSGSLSGLSPMVGKVHIDRSLLGRVYMNLASDCDTYEVIVTNPVPVPWSVEIINPDDTFIGHGVYVLMAAFNHWIPLIRQIGVLHASDPASDRILCGLSEVAIWMANPPKVPLRDHTPLISYQCPSSIVRMKTVPGM